MLSDRIFFSPSVRCFYNLTGQDFCLTPNDVGESDQLMVYLFALSTDSFCQRDTQASGSQGDEPGRPPHVSSSNHEEYDEEYDEEIKMYY